MGLKKPLADTEKAIKKLIAKHEVDLVEGIKAWALSDTGPVSFSGPSVSVRVTSERIVCKVTFSMKEED